MQASTYLDFRTIRGSEETYKTASSASSHCQYSCQPPWPRYLFYLSKIIIRSSASKVLLKRTLKPSENKVLRNYYCRCIYVNGKYQNAYDTKFSEFFHCLGKKSSQLHQQVYLNHRRNPTIPLCGWQSCKPRINILLEKLLPIEIYTMDGSTKQRRLM